MILLVTINTIRYRGQRKHYYPSMTFSEIFHHIYHQINVLPASPVNSVPSIPLLSSSFRPSQSLFSLFLLPPNSLAPHHCQNGLPKIPMWPHHLHTPYKLTKHLRGKWIKDIVMCPQVSWDSWSIFYSFLPCHAAPSLITANLLLCQYLMPHIVMPAFTDLFILYATLTSSYFICFKNL